MKKEQSTVSGGAFPNKLNRDWYFVTSFITLLASQKYTKQPQILTASLVDIKIEIRYSLTGS
jgi:hypothetical protein